jgi:hypothetical protein
VRPWQLAELFAAGNLAFLAVDVWIAHATNAFERAPEWIPVVFSIAAPVLLVAAALLGGRSIGGDYPLRAPAAPIRVRFARNLGMLVGWASVAVGVGGMLLHLQSHFFEQQTIRNLVYTAPFVAPLAYAGIGLVLILDRMVDSESVEWAQWVVFLALGGFLGNFVLSLADHAQNGFFNRFEWVPVIAAAVAVAFLLLVVVRPGDRMLLRATGWVLAAQAIVGMAGFFFHVRANLAAEGPNLFSKFVFGAPAFAPLLFANLAILAAIGLWPLIRRG